jgi:hypothetical protein
MSRQPPVWMVLALLIAAALACRVEFSTAHLEKAATYRDPGGETRTRSFGTSEPVYCIVDLKDTGSEPLAVRMVLNQVMTRDDGTPEEVEIAREERNSRSAQLIFTLDPPAGHWEKGDYKIRLYLDGDQKQTLDFKIK